MKREWNMSDLLTGSGPRYEGPMPAWVSQARIRKSKTGRSWCVTIFGAMDPRSSMENRIVRYYYPVAKFEKEAHLVNWCLHRAQGLRVRYQGSVLVMDARATLTSPEGKMLSWLFRRYFDGGGFYEDEEAQHELRRILGNRERRLRQDGQRAQASP